MKRQRRQRLILSILLVGTVGAALALGLTALEQNINLFFSPTQVRAGEAPQHNNFRIGGMVVANSVERNASDDDLRVTFQITDTETTVPIEYTGILPDLFREGQGVVALGKMQGSRFVASEILAKHDETYMAPEVSDALKAAHENRINDRNKSGSKSYDYSNAQ